MNLTSILKAALFTPANGARGLWGLPIDLEGPPGVGKSAQLTELGRSCGLHVEVVIASLREPADFLGLPVPNKNGRVDYYPPAWAVRAEQAGRALVFLDELNTAAPAVQAALLRVVNERQIGDLMLPPGVRFLAAQNKTETAAGGWDLAAPMANRFGHLPWDAPAAADWSAWLLSSGTQTETVVDPKAAEAIEKDVLTKWDKAYAVARGTVTGFLRSRTSLLLQEPPSGDPKASKAWPSPRTWEMATRAFASATVHNLSPADRDDFVGSFIGQAAYGEFLTFLQNADLPDPELLLDGKVTFEHDPRRLDRTCAVLSSCAAFLEPPTLKRRDERAKALWTLMLPTAKAAADLIYPAGISMVRHKLMGFPEAKEVLRELSPILRAAGVQAGA